MVVLPKSNSKSELRVKDTTDTPPHATRKARVVQDVVVSQSMEPDTYHNTTQQHTATHNNNNNNNTIPHNTTCVASTTPQQEQADMGDVRVVVCALQCNQNAQAHARTRSSPRRNNRDDTPLSTARSSALVPPIPMHRTVCGFEYLHQ